MHSKYRCLVYDSQITDYLNLDALIIIY